MAVIRVDDAAARELRLYGKTYDEALKALLEKQKENEKKVDYEKIRGIVSDEITKVAH